jgi:hypothetical protein
MSKRAWTGYIASAALLASATFSAQAAFIDFEGVFDIVSPPGSYVEDGFQLSPIGGDALIDASFCSFPDYCAVGNVSTYITALNDATLKISNTGPSPFSLLGFDASFVPTPSLDYSGMDIRLQLAGLLSGGGSIAAEVSLVVDASGDAHFASLGSLLGTAALTELTFGVCFFDGIACLRGFGLALNDAQFALDNIELNTSEIPEPPAVWLLAMALTGLVASRRRILRPSLRT